MDISSDMFSACLKTVTKPNKNKRAEEQIVFAFAALVPEISYFYVLSHEVGIIDLESTVFQS